MGVGGEKFPKDNLFLAYCFIIFLLKYFTGALYNTYIAQFELHILLFSLLTCWWYLRFGMGTGYLKMGTDYSIKTRILNKLQDVY